MPVAARNNSFGAFTYSETVLNHWGYVNDDGYSSSDQGYGDFENHTCGRDGKSSNPLHNNHGIPNYRDPSNYYRWVWDIKGIQGESKRIPSPPNGTTYYWQRGFPTGPLNKWCGWETFGGRYLNYENIEVQNVRNRTRVDMRNKLSDMKANIGEDLATAKQTYGLIAENGIALVSALINARRGNFAGAARALGLTSSKGISRNILEFQYGWRPLMSDIYGSVQLLREQLSLPPIITARKTTRLSLEESPTLVDVGGYTSHSFSFTSCCTAILDGTYSHAVQQTGLDDPLLLAWELVPWSFVVDWVLPIGPMIQALHATSGLIFVSGWEQGRLESKVKTHMILPSDWEGSSPSVEGSGFMLRRDRLEDFPGVLPYIKSPFSMEHGLNLLALLTQLRR